MIRLLLCAAILMMISAIPGLAQTVQYWKIGSDSSNVWSLSDNGLRPITDPAYVAWHAAGNNPTHIASAAELYDVIANSYPTSLSGLGPALEEQVGALRPDQAYLWRRAAGLNINYTGQPALNGRYAIDDFMMIGLFSGATLRCGTTAIVSCDTPFPYNLSTYQYLDADMTAHTVSIVQLRIIALKIQDYVATLQEQLVIGRNGGTPSWPSLSATVP